MLGKVLILTLILGGSVLQSPLIMPMLMLPGVPSHHAGHQTAYLLHNSEHFFPPLNAVCTLTNLILTGFAFYYSRGTAASIPGTSAHIAAGKFPRVGLAALLNVCTTIWALTIMVPMNKKMAAIAGEMEKGVKDGEAEGQAYKKNESELRRLQARWTKLNYGRAMIMVGASLAGFSALLGMLMWLL
jgi:hypothetical protein